MPMSERWQNELAKLRGVNFGDDLWDRVVAGPRLEPAHSPSRSRFLAAAVALAVFALAGVMLWDVFRPLGDEPPTLAGSDVVRVPPRGEAVAAFLSDGHPVFVVHQPDGFVVAVDALSPHRHLGIEQLVAWCEPKRFFVSWPDGSFFLRSGRWWGGRAAAPGLYSVTFDVLSRDAEGDAATVRLRKIVPPWGGHPTGSINDPVPASACGLADGDFSNVLIHQVPPVLVWGSPAAAARTEVPEWIAIDGVLHVSPGGAVSLCARVDGSVCRNGARVNGLQGRRLFDTIQSDTTSRFARTRTWLARVNDGAIVELAMFPEPRP
jgi:hypothetical protein